MRLPVFPLGGRVGHGCTGSAITRETDVREDVGSGRGGGRDERAECAPLAERCIAVDGEGAPRTWRTREDPFANVWQSEVVPQLVADTEGRLQALTLFTELWCARLTGEGQPVEVRRKEGVTNHFRPESCAGRCEAAGEALTAARTGRAIEHRKRERLERRDCHSGRRQHRHHRNGEGGWRARAPG